MHITTLKEGISSQTKAIFSRIFKTAKSKTTKRSASKTVALFLVFSVISWLFGVPLGVLVPIHEVQAAITETAAASLVSGSSITPDGSGYLKFTLESSAGEENFTQIKFTVSQSAGTIDNSDFNADGAVIAFEDTDGDEALNFGTDSMMFTILPDNLNIGSETVAAVDCGGACPTGEDIATSPGNNYFLIFMTSASASNGDAFNIILDAGTDTYILSAGTVSATAFSTTITVDNVAPTATSTGGPANGATGVPIFAMIDRQFSENLNSATVTTSNVSLKTNTGNTQGGAPTGSNLCTSVSLLDNNRIECAHSDLSINTWYSFAILTGVTDVAGNALAAVQSYVFQTGSVDSGNNTTKPWVQSTSPSSMATNVALNTKILVQFPMGPEGNMLVDGTTNALNKVGNFSLKPITNGVLGSEICSNITTACVPSWDATARQAKITLGSALTANTQYDFCIRANVVNTVGQSLPSDYCAHFTSGSSSDTTAPALRSTNSTSPANGATNVSQYTPDLWIAFSEELDASTVTLSNVRLYLDADSSSTNNVGDTTLGATQLDIRYDNVDRSVHLNPKVGLTASKRYCFEVTANIKDLAGNAITAVSNKCFTTGSTSDTTKPTLLFADADNYKLTATFNEPVAASTAETIGNYALVCSGTTINLSGKTITYYPEFREAEIEGLGLTADQSCTLTIGAGIQDLAGNSFSTTANTASFKILDSAATGGMVGTRNEQDFYSGTDFGTFWERPTRAEPRSKVAGATTKLEVEFPVPAALTTGATFVITAPSGFDASSVAAIAASENWANTDLNGPGPGTTTISGVSATTSTITVTIAHSGTAMSANDQIFFILKDLVNPSTPLSEARFSIVIKDADGVKVGQTIQAAPFSIYTGGAYSISGSVYKDSNSNNIKDVGEGIASAKVFCDSFGGYGADGMMAGHQEATTDASGDYSVGNLTNGEYGCGVPPDPTTFNNLTGGGQFKNVYLSGSSVTGVDFKFTDLSTTGKTLNVTISSSAALSGKDVDVFCHAGMSDFEFSMPIFKQVTLNASGGGTTSLKLQPGTTYECGVGPHVPFESFQGGGPPPVPDFDFMPPAMQRVAVPTDSNPSAVTFALEVASNTITGYVKDGSNNGIANMYVDAFPMGCFDATTGEGKACFGGFAQTKTDGSFTLKVAPGIYEVSAGGPGMPRSEPTEVTVATDGSLTSKGVTITSVTIKLNKTSTTISGQVKDEGGNGIQYAWVDAEKITAGGSCSSFTSQGGFIGSPTDSSGNYTLYAGNGTWNVRANAPSYGEIGCVTVVVSGSSKTGQNIQATAADFKTISGTALDGAFINAWSPNIGGNHTKATGGSYSLKVKAGSGYTVECFAHGKGPCGRQTSVDVSASNATVNFETSISTGTVQVTITGITDAFVDLKDSNGKGFGTGQNNNGVYTILLPAGTYTLKGGSPKYGEICGGQSVTVTASQTTAKTCTAPSNLRTVAGRVTDGTNNLAGASVILTDNSGKIFNVTTDAKTGANNNLSVTNVREGSYTVTASKDGYEPASTTAAVSGGNLTLSSPIAITQASGTSGATVTATVQADSANYSSKAVVVASKGTSTVVKEIDKTTGQASLGLTNGTWTVTAYGDNGKQSSASTVTVTNGSLVGTAPTFDLATSISGFTAASDTKSLTPSSGGLVTSSNINGLSANIPASTLSATDSSSGSIEFKLDPTVAAIDPGANQNFVGSGGYEINPKDSNGKDIGKTLSGEAVLINIPYTDADVSTAGVDESQMVIGALNANGVWETFDTTVDTTNNILTAKVTHFSSFGVLGAVAAAGRSSSDVIPPAEPRDVQASISDSKIVLTWTDPADTDLSQIIILRNSGGNTPISGTTYAIVNAGVKTYTDANVEVGKTYKYILRAKDSSGNTETNTTAYSVTVVAGEAAPSAPTTGEEVVAEPTPAEEEAAPAEEVVVTPTEVRNLAAERKALPEFARIYGRLPQIKADWNNLKKLAAGAEPQRSLSAEREALADFGKLYGRMPESSKDWQALHWMAYGVKPAKRSVVKEAAALADYITVYHKLPVKSTDWHIVRSLAYVLAK